MLTWKVDGYWKVNILGLLYKLEKKAYDLMCQELLLFLKQKRSFHELWRTEARHLTPPPSFFFCYCYGDFMVGSGSSYCWIA